MCTELFVSEFIDYFTQPMNVCNAVNKLSNNLLCKTATLYKYLVSAKWTNINSNRQIIRILFNYILCRSRKHIIMIIILQRNSRQFQRTRRCSQGLQLNYHGEDVARRIGVQCTVETYPERIPIVRIPGTFRARRPTLTFSALRTN